MQHITCIDHFQVVTRFGEYRIALLFYMFLLECGFKCHTNYTANPVMTHNETEKAQNMGGAENKLRITLNKRTSN
jgi:K+-transporting ATPase A subunit